MNVLKIVACLLFFSFVWCVGYGDTPLKQKKEDQAKQDTVDGPYVLYDEVGNARVIRVDERGVVRDSVYGKLPEGFKLDVVSQKGGHRFQVKLHPVECPLWKSGQREKTLIISDVKLFPGHIECRTESSSEIEVTIIKEGNVIGVLDIDSDTTDSFDETDARYLEEICTYIR